MEILSLYFLSCILCQKLLHHGNILNRKNMSPVKKWSVLQLENGLTMVILKPLSYWYLVLWKLVIKSCELQVNLALLEVGICGN